MGRRDDNATPRRQDDRPAIPRRESGEQQPSRDGGRGKGQGKVKGKKGKVKGKKGKGKDRGRGRGA